MRASKDEKKKEVTIEENNLLGTLNELNNSRLALFNTNAQHEQLKKSLDEIDSIIEKKNSEISILEKRIAEFDKVLKDKEKESIDIDVKIADNKKILVAKNYEIADIGVSIKKLTEEYTKLNKDIISNHQTIKQATISEMEYLTESKSSLALSVDEINKRISSANILFAEVTTLVEDKKKELEKICSDVEIAKTNQSIVHDKISDYDKALSDVVSKIDLKNTELIKLTKEFDETNLKVSSVQEELSHLVKSKIEFITKKGELDQREEYLKAKYQEAGISWA